MTATASSTLLLTSVDVASSSSDLAWEAAAAGAASGSAFLVAEQTAGRGRRGAAWSHAARIIEDFDVRCPSPQARIRLLSGGNIQKLILGRVFALDPRLILANQPTRGLDVGAVAYVQERLLAARGAGAAVILISEDLDELMALSDRIAVIYRGCLSPAMPREEVTVRKLGLMMAGHDPGEVGDAA